MYVFGPAKNFFEKKTDQKSIIRVLADMVRLIQM